MAIEHSVIMDHIHNDQAEGQRYTEGSSIHNNQLSLSKLLYTEHFYALKIYH